MFNTSLRSLALLLVHHVRLASCHSYSKGLFAHRLKSMWGKNTAVHLLEKQLLLKLGLSWLIKVRQ